MFSRLVLQAFVFLSFLLSSSHASGFVKTPDAWSDYLAAKAAWDAEIARIQAEYDAANAQYLIDSAQYAVDLAAYNAALASSVAYPGDVETARLLTVSTFVDAVVIQEPLLFSASWAGPWGYAGVMSSWMNGAADVAVPPAMAGPWVWIQQKLVAASLSTVEWSAHVSATKAYEALRLNPPVVPPEPVAPVPPAPPVFPPAPVPPPPPTAATYLADPTGYVIQATGVRVATTCPIRDLWLKAKPGEIISLMDGDYRRTDLKKSTRAVGSAPVVFRGIGPGRPILKRQLGVGSDALNLGVGVADSAWEHIDIEVSDRAGLKTVPGTGPNHRFKDVRVFGYGDPTSGAWTDAGMWGLHLYESSNWTLEDVSIFSVFKEHASYDHGRQGDVTWRRVTAKWCGRTAYQDVSRQSEGPIGKGNILLEDCRADDVCLEDGGGGSAFTFRGGSPTSTVTLRRVIGRLGCDPALAFPFNKNITGCLLVDSGGGAYPGPAYAEVMVDSCDFEVGSVWPGVSNARRANVKIESVPKFTLKDTRIVQGPQANPIALEILPSVGDVFVVGTNTIVGRVKYDGVEYMTYAAWIAARDADGNGKIDG